LFGRINFPQDEQRQAQIAQGSYLIGRIIVELEGSPQVRDSLVNLSPPMQNVSKTVLRFALNPTQSKSTAIGEHRSPALF